MSNGIWGHSGPNGGEKYIIAGLDSPETMLDVQDWFRDNVPVKDGATGYKLLYGSWRGKKETSIIFNAKHWDAANGGLWGFFNKEEAIILLDAANARDRRQLTFYAPCFNCGHLEPVPYLNNSFGEGVPIYITEVTKEEAEASPGYTFDPSNGTYFLAKP